MEVQGYQISKRIRGIQITIQKVYPVIHLNQMEAEGGKKSRIDDPYPERFPFSFYQIILFANKCYPKYNSSFDLQEKFTISHSGYCFAMKNPFVVAYSNWDFEKNLNWLI